MKKENSAIGYSEGSEPIKLTDAQRIRNKAIDDCIKIVKKRHYAMAFIKELESIKSDSK